MLFKVIVGFIAAVATALVVYSVREEAARQDNMQERVAALQSKMDAVQADMKGQWAELMTSAATFIKHVRESHMPPPVEWLDVEWPLGWHKLELVCPTKSWSRLCRTPEYFHEHPYEAPK